MNEDIDQSDRQESLRLEYEQYSGPLYALAGEIRVTEADKAGWCGTSKLYGMINRGDIASRRASRYNTYIKIDDLKKIFGETAPGIRRRKRKSQQQKPIVPLNITKEERRIIFGEIDSHYLDESRGYAAEWDDEKVAASLKVPVGWVRSVREENFGPEKGDEVDLAVKELQSHISDADAILGKMRTFWVEKDQIIKKIIESQHHLVGESKKVHAAIETSRAKIHRLTKKQ